jgi:pyruvate/2-oxoglutarate dehydrogenase complex dihydrolipoamide dehydrogenase (E3) component
MNAELKPDLCIIGGGAAGVSLSLGAAACGLSVMLIEKNSLGGYRLTHSVPRNVLLAVSRAASAWCGSPDVGATVKELRQDPSTGFLHIRKHIKSLVTAIAPNYSQARLEAMNVAVIRAAGRFTHPDICEADGRRIKARRYVVATGAIERTLPIPGLDLVRPLDCTSLSTLDRPPSCLIVIGADPDGLALAQAMRRFGSDVIVLTDTKIFSREDEELAAPVRAAFARDGIVLHEGVRISRIEPRGDGVRVFVAAAGHEKSIIGSHLWIAAGRAPVVEGLGLTEARVRYSQNGIETRGGFTTSNRRIQAIGSVVQGEQHDGAAEQHLWLVLRTILGRAPWRKQAAGARVILTSPPIALTGLSEAQARATNHHVQVLRWPFSATERGQIEHQTGGHVKLLANRRGTILGAGIVGQGAEELINLCTLAISKSMTVSDIAAIMVSYPAQADAVRRASMLFPLDRLNNSMTPHVLRFLR